MKNYLGDQSMEREMLLSYLEGFCSKELKAVDCNEGSNQHEFNVNKDMKKLLGGDERHFTNSSWLYIGKSEQIKTNDTLSLYDARKKHPTRSEWRLYYGGNDAIEKAREGDWLYILKLSQDLLILLIIEKDTNALAAVRYLLKENSVCLDDTEVDNIHELLLNVIEEMQEREQEEDDSNALEEANQYDIVDNALVRNSMLQISFNSLILGIEQGDYIIPGFQRFYRWTETQVENLAVSFIRGMPIPPIYCYRNKEHQLVILDGQQRVLSLYLYYKGQYFKRKRNASADLRNVGERNHSIPEMLKNYEMKEKQYFMKIRNQDGNVHSVEITYSNLSKEVKRQLDYFTLTIISIDIDKEEYRDTMLHKIFANLNTGGTPLSDQELRNGIFYNKFYIMLFNLNRENQKWRMLYGGSTNSRESKKSKDVELLLRMCAFSYYTKLQGTEIKIDNYKENMSIFLDQFSKETETFSDEQIQNYKCMLELFFRNMENASGKNKNSGLVSFFVAWNLLENKCNISEKVFRDITEKNEYKNTILSHASGRMEIEERFNYVYQRLSKID